MAEQNNEKTIYITRHGEGYHQGEPTSECEQIKDAELTPKGIEQCKHLCAVFPFHDKIDLVVASPLRRAIQTALIGYAPYVAQGNKILLMPDLQETSSKPMDIGSSRASLEREFGDVLDYSRMYEGWEQPEGKHATDTASLLERGARMRRYLRDREERGIMAVFHGAFAHYVTGTIVNDGEQTGDDWMNASWRMYRFEEDGLGSPILVQKEESRARTLPGQANARDDVGL